MAEVHTFPTRLRGVRCARCGRDGLFWHETAAGVRVLWHLEPVPYVQGLSSLVIRRNRFAYANDVWPEPDRVHMRHRCQVDPVDQAVDAMWAAEDWRHEVMRLAAGIPAPPPAKRTRVRPGRRQA